MAPGPGWVFGVGMLALASGAWAMAPRAASLVEVLDAGGSGTDSNAVFNGGAGSFPAPTLRYVVGTKLTEAPQQSSESLIVFGPLPGQVFSGKAFPRFAWAEPEEARYFRIEIADRKGEVIYSAVEPVASRRHTPDASLRARAGTQPVRWRIVALSNDFVEIGATTWTEFRFK